MPRNLDYPMPMHGRMVRQRLWEAQQDAAALYQTLRDDDRIPAWTIDKVATGANNIAQVGRYLRFKASNPVDWGAPNVDAIPDHPDAPFYRAVLRGLGIPITPNTMTLFYAWRQAEGGKATYNPFNTTHKTADSTPYRTNVAKVQEYKRPQDGVDATIKTMSLSYYKDVINALRNNLPPEDVAQRIIASPWGTKQILNDVLAMYRRGKFTAWPIETISGAPPLSSLEKAAGGGGGGPKRRGEPQRRGFSLPWWAWAGGALMVLLGGAAVYSLITDKPPRPAALPPAQNPRKRRHRR